jgi:hypothetical protein
METIELIIRNMVTEVLQSFQKPIDVEKVLETVFQLLEQKPEIKEQEEESILTYLVLSEILSQKEQIPDIVRKVSIEIENGKTSEQLKYVLDHHREAAINQRFMHIAAASNNVEAIQIMLDKGISPEVRCNEYPKQVPLYNATRAGSIEAAELLLNAGANIEENNNNTSATPLLCAVTAGKSDMVKFLIDRGANIHAEYTLGKGTKLNALKLAVLEKHHELVAFFRAKGVAWISDKIPTDHTPETSRLQFLSKYFKSHPLPLGLTEIVPDSVPMLVHVFPPAKRKRKTTILVTSGLSDYMLTVSDENTEFAFAEYFIEVPGHWDLSKESLDKDQFFWPIRWLKTIGRYPHENETFYGMEQIITNSKIPSLSTPDNKYCCAKVQRIPALDYVIPQDGRFTIFYQITPLEQKIEEKTTN